MGFKYLLPFLFTSSLAIPTYIEKLSELENANSVLYPYYQPRHVHISYGDNPTEFLITWSTLSDSENSIVEYGIYSLSENRLNGTRKQFTDSGPSKLIQFIHRAKLTNLQAGQRYIYHCGSDRGWSEVFYFQVMPNASTNWLPSLAIYGDLGSDNAPSMGRLQNEVQLGMYDAILHVGDFAYDMNTDNGLVGDAFMKQIQPIAAYVPYMTCPGNHENANNFSHYKNRFTMPGNSESMYYSFNMGPIHFISLSTEFYYYLNYGLSPLIKQYYWLLKDLKEATKPENRAIRPWIITYGHRPMYWSNNNTDEYTGKHDSRVRVGIPYLNMFGLEDIFMQHGVDLSIWAHQHSYERMFPLYNFQVYNGSVDEPYRNPKAIVHLTTGSAGCSEKHDDFGNEKPSWTAFRSTDYGYTRLKIINASHLYLEQVSDDQNGKVIDSMILIRENHGSYFKPSKTH